MKIKSILTSSVFVLSVLATSLYAGELKFHEDFKSAQAEAKKSGKPIVTIFSASWCPPCQHMKKNVYPSAAVTPYHDQFVWAYLDADKPKNKSIMKANGVEGIPHISYISAEGNKLGKTVGGMSADDFTKVLASVLEK